MRLLITGSPGVGKTTLIRTILKKLEGVECAGFYTEEKRHQGQRIGFKIITLDGREGTLASIGRNKPTIGRYSVHVEEFERLALSQLDPDITRAELYVIDEIGKMELLSRKFRTKVIDLLAVPSNFVGTVAKKGKGFIEQIKSRNDIELIEMTRENRDHLPDQIAKRIKKDLGIV